MAFFRGEDLFGGIEGIVFPMLLENYGAGLSADRVAAFRGRVDMNEEETPKILCEEIVFLNPGEAGAGEGPPAEAAPAETEEKPKKLYLRMLSTETDRFERISSLFAYFSGSTQVVIKFSDTGKIMAGVSADVNPQLLDRLAEELGGENVKAV